MASNFVRQVPSTDNRDEIHANLDENGCELAFLSQFFDILAEQDSKGNAIQLTAPSLWGLASIIRRCNETMNDAYSELK